MQDLPKHLERNFPAQSNTLAKVLSQGINVTTTYSGIGIAEIAGATLTKNTMVNDALSDAGLYFHSAADILPEARSALMGHWQESAPCHIFGDVVKRLEPQAEDAVRTMTRSFLQACGEVRDDIDEGMQLVHMLENSLEKAAFKATAYCFRHCKECPLAPPLLGSRRQRVMHMEVAGITCCPWSSMNRGRFTRWRNSATLPCMVMRFWILATRPSIFIIENVKGFDSDAFMHTFHSQNLYVSTEVLVSPSMLGIPSSRTRKFIIAWSTQEFTKIQSMGPEVTFQALFQRTLVTTVQIYEAASLDAIVELKRALAKAKGLDAVLTASQLQQMPSRSLLPGGLSERQKAYYESYQAHVQEGGGKLESAWVDLNQHIGFYRTITDIAPAMLHSSKMWSLLSRRPIAVQELFAAMGFAPPGLQVTDSTEQALLDDLCKASWPWRDDSGEPVIPAELTHQRLGNGMHMAVIGSIMTMALSLYAPQWLV